MNEVARAKKKLADTKLQAAKSQQEVMRLLQAQHSQIQQLQVPLCPHQLARSQSPAHRCARTQQIAYGTSSPWSLGLAYRIPDTNINLSYGFQQGRSNVQASCVPDESAAMLGPNGFVRGVGPGNLGVTVNLSV
jgi:hypothetical protein